MILRAKQDGNTVVFELEGHLDFETTVRFQQNCKEILSRNDGSRVILNMEKLRFVGSSGINQFIMALKELNHFPTKPKYCKVSSEFQKIFKAYQTTRNPFDVFEDEKEAMAAFDAPVVPKKTRKKKEINN